MKTIFSSCALALLVALAVSSPAPARAEGFFLDRGYVNFSGGVALQQDLTLRNSLGEHAEATFDPGLSLDVALGVVTARGLAFELQTGLIVNSFDTINGVSLDAVGG